MTCKVILNKEQEEWFKARPVAWAIVNDGRDDVGGSEQKMPAKVLEAVLANMGDYGAKNWTYAPGANVHADNTLKTQMTVTDCDSLAEMMRDIAKALGYVDARTKKIVNEGHRVVTARDLACFTDKKGDAELDGRWCFGDHWVMIYQSRTYDPTFVTSYNSGEADPSFGWWAREDRSEQGVFTNTVWKADGQRDVFMGQVPPIPSRAAIPARQARGGFCGIGARPARPAQPAVAPVPGRGFYTFVRTNQAGQEVS